MSDARREQQRGGRPPGTKPTRVVARAIMERGAARASSAMFGRVQPMFGTVRVSLYLAGGVR
jgi:hypothetical protein